MPNWCVTNWQIQGPKEKVQKFCDTVNDLANRDDVAENGFGKYWLVNLAAALGLDHEELHKQGANLRGTIEEEELSPTLFFPGKGRDEKHEKIENHFLPENDLYWCSFSTVSAWSEPVWLEKYFEDNGIECGYKATDEFRNFNVVHNTKLFPDIYEVEADDCWETFNLGEEKKLAEYFNDHSPKVKLDVDAITDFESLCEECHNHEEEMHDAHVWIWIYDEV